MRPGAAIAALAMLALLQRLARSLALGPPSRFTAQVGRTLRTLATVPAGLRDCRCR